MFSINNIACAFTNKVNGFKEGEVIPVFGDFQFLFSDSVERDKHRSQISGNNKIPEIWESHT